MTLNEMPQIMTEPIQVSMQHTSQRLGSTIETLSRAMLAESGSAPTK